MNVELPRRIMIEKDIAGKIDSALHEMNLGKKCLIICDKHLIEIGKKIRSSLTFETQMVASSSMDVEFLKKLSQVMRNFDFTLAIGGGRTIDAAKYSSTLANKPWIAFPTVLSHDGIVSSRAVVDTNGEKTSVNATEPAAIFADIDILKNSPYRYTAAGAGDCLANISAVEDWKLAERAGKDEYQTIVGELALLSAKAIVNHATEIKECTEHGIEMLMWSLICSGFAMNIHGSSRPASGSEHNFSHALDKITSNTNFEERAIDNKKTSSMITSSEGASNRPLHGEQCALGTMIMTYLQGESGPVLSMRKGLFSRKEFDWHKIRDVMQVLELPTTARELGVDEYSLIRALVEARNVRDRYTILNEKNIDSSEAERILRRLGII